MAICRLELQNFRNFKSFAADIPQMVYVYGDNGVGKTSLSEAITLLLTLKSFRRDNAADFKMSGEEYVRVKGAFLDERIKDAVYFYRDKRAVLVDGNEQQNVSEYIYTLPVVCYSPGFESVFSQQSFERRRFLDRMIFYSAPQHLNDIRQYNAILARKRVELCKDAPDAELVAALNERAQPFSDAISARRRELIDKINEAAAANAETADKFLPDMRLALHIYPLSDRDEQKELARGRPSYGCHKDLLYLKQNEKVVEKFQSFGQMKSALLYLLYCFAINVEDYRKCGIIVVLDDFEAGLDAMRCGTLNELFLGGSSDRRQIFLTGLNVKHYKGVETLALPA